MIHLPPQTLNHLDFFTRQGLHEEASGLMVVLGSMLQVLGKAFRLTLGLQWS